MQESRLLSSLKLQTMLSSNRADVSVLPRSPVNAATSCWSFDFESSSSSSDQIDRFLRPFGFSDEILPPSIDLEEPFRQHAAGRSPNEEGGAGTSRFSLPTEYLQHLQPHHCGRLAHVDFQDAAARNRKPGLLVENCNTPALQPLASSDYDESCTTGFSKRPKLSELAAQPVETKAEMSPSQMKKLGGRITTLQQLVSPFGKTDTASVLLNAIEYIKFLQEQVQRLSSPYMERTLGQKTGRKRPRQSEGSQGGADLRSRGLCLVPISCAPEVASNNGADYWASGISRS